MIITIDGKECAKKLFSEENQKKKNYNENDLIQKLINYLYTKDLYNDVDVEIMKILLKD